MGEVTSDPGPGPNIWIGAGVISGWRVFGGRAVGGLVDIALDAVGVAPL